ncbi:hypothetical protein P691DRAFT_805466 [Macrolepiota fuliginosa MF-IS2]|uniref:Stress-activated map kinase-interacting protein n=1 Tax=Macrolepiota fuliginosa MF-IS2 TaxID=1400762 RepID=A0A9P5X9L2_9AGAR|nr:hypothetical protein P691DRAFT_805466 [Macrolepiota fuliginosa MF-IS2]
MSIISDTDYLIHNIRLSYLKEVEDLYGPRIIAFDPSYTSNPYITHATLADSERWPELSLPQSPQISEDEADRPSGFPGAKLKYTQTIMGGRSGGLGLRVSGKRASTSKRMSRSNIQVPQVDVQYASGSQGTSSPSSVTKDITAASAADWPRVPDGPLPASSPQPPVSAPTVTPTTESPSPQPEVKVEAPSVVEEAPVTKVVQFVPKFKGSAEMERRRRARMAARRGPNGALAAPAPPPQTLSFSSSEDEPQPQSSDESSSDSDFGGRGGRDAVGEVDEFDPEFAATRTTMTSISDDLSVLSGGTNSMTNSSAPISYTTNTRLRPKLSPVSETGHLSLSRSHQQSVDEHFEMLTPAVSIDDTSKQPNLSATRNRTASGSSTKQPSVSTPASDTLFSRKKVAPIKPQQSTLSGMLSRGKSSNPFTEIYASVSGRSAPASTTVSVYFPHAKRPAGKSLELTVSRDATVEEVIGFALWTYWEESWLPKLDEGLSGPDDPQWEDRISACGWVLRLAEDDGEVDDDFPPPDRLGKIAKFNADAFAILEATPAQIKQNREIESKIQRPTKTPAKKQQDKLAAPAHGPSAAASSSLLIGSWGASAPISMSLGPSNSHGPQIFLRIRVDTADAVHISTTIPVSAGMYMQEALEMVCRRRKLANPKDYALLLADRSILIPLDRTVASLQGNRELLLVKRSVLPMLGGNIVKAVGKTTDPNASIFKSTDTPEIQYTTPLDYTAAYKKYTIYRKMPMMVARQERTLAVDGEWVHIMPSSNKAKNVFDSGRTSSYHVKTIADCQQSSKSSATFKLVLTRGGGTTKRYDFEAESPRVAAEIVATIKNLKSSLERSGTVNKSRRSRQVV